MKGAVFCCASLVMSTSTGPGRPGPAMWYAAAMVAGMSSTSFTRKECLVIGIVMPTMSASWKASVPISVENTWPAMNTTGTEAMSASRVARARLVAAADLGSGSPGQRADQDLIGAELVAGLVDLALEVGSLAGPWRSDNIAVITQRLRLLSTGGIVTWIVDDCWPQSPFPLFCL